MGKNKRKNIALFLAMLENEFSISVLEGARRGAEEVNANLFVFPVGLINGEYRHKEHNKFRYQYNVLNSFIKSHSIDAAVIEYGTIVSSVDDKKKQEYLSTIGDVPVVLLSEAAKGYPSICINNSAGLEDVIRHLINDHNCFKIGFVSGPRTNHDAQDRLNVYKKVMKEYNLDCSDDWIEYGNFSIYSEDVVTNLVKRHPDIEGIVFANDHMALGGIEALKAMNKVPGKDILITGFDNIPSSILSEPSLTTVAADASQLSYNAILALNNGDITFENQFISSHMIKRESCGCRLCTEDADQTSPENAAITIRDATRNKVHEAELRKQFEVEIANVNREMLSPNGSEHDWTKSVSNIAKKMKLGNMFLFLYKDSISHDGNSPWIQPRYVDLRSAYKDKESYTYVKDEYVFSCDDIFNDEFIVGDERIDAVITPLFFREHQYGFMVVESDIKNFQFAFSMANQVSSSLEIVNILNVQERIKKELEYASKSKSQFIANMSHEIRTPINAILGMNEMILRENNVPEIDEYALNIKNAANTLLSLVNDILDFSKIEAGKMSIIPVEYKFESMLNDIVSIISTRVEEKNLKLELNIDPSTPSVIYGDDVRIRQVLFNLLSNAVKYTEKGTITISVSSNNIGESADITFSIKDTGIGIKQEDLPHLFVKFERLDEKKNRHIEGTGLGMNITIGLLELMGSTLHVSSVYGKGSDFSFTLRQKVIDATPISNNTKVKKANEKVAFKQKFTAPDVKILVVDDIEINRVIIASLLKQSEIQIDEAANGIQCVEMVNKEKYDLILLDHMMPQMDGMEALEEIRKNPDYSYDKLPVIVLTANAINGFDKMYLDAGFNDYISKPVDSDFLDEIIIKHICPEKIKFND